MKKLIPALAALALLSSAAMAQPDHSQHAHKAKVVQKKATAVKSTQHSMKAMQKKAAAVKGTQHNMKAMQKMAKAPLVCPVTGEKIASVKQAAGKSTYKGKTYYFCCAGCKPKFDKAPAKYAQNAAKGKFEKM